VTANGGDAAVCYDSKEVPNISFHDGSNLKYAKLNGTSWDIQTVDADGWTGWYTSLVIDAADCPHISYLHRGDLDLKYAHWNGSSWDTETVDSQNETGFYSSLALDALGKPSIAYYDRVAQGSGELRFAALDGTSWLIQTIDSSGDVGRYSSLAIDSDGWAHIAYYDDGSNDLKYAKGVPEPATLALLAVGAVGLVAARKGR